MAPGYRSVICFINGDAGSSDLAWPRGSLGLMGDPLGGTGIGTASLVSGAEAGDPMIASVPGIASSAIQLRNIMARIAEQEWLRWNQPKKIYESQAKAKPMLKAYWQTGVGLGYTEPSGVAWSAAFISYVVRMAGGGDQFTYARAHSTYIRACIKNRLEKKNSPFNAYRVNEVVPVVGDLVCTERAGSGANYDTIQKAGFRETHVDVVTEVEKGNLVTIGGNVGNSVSKTNVKTDSNGCVNAKGYFAVIKVVGVGAFLIEAGSGRIA